MGPLHAYALATRLTQVSDHPLSLNQGTLYPALVRLEHKGRIKGSWRPLKATARRSLHHHQGRRARARPGRAVAPAPGLVDKLLLERP